MDIEYRDGEYIFYQDQTRSVLPGDKYILYLGTFQDIEKGEMCGNIQVKGILKKEFRSKLEVKNRKIYDYMSNNILKIEDIMNNYKNYIYTIIMKLLE